MGKVKPEITAKLRKLEEGEGVVLENLKRANRTWEDDEDFDSLSTKMVFEPANPKFKPALPQFTYGIKLNELFVQKIRTNVNLDKINPEARSETENLQNFAIVFGAARLRGLANNMEESLKINKPKAFAEIVPWSHSDTLREDTKNNPYLTDFVKREISDIADQHIISSPNFAEYYKNILVPNKTKEYIIPLLDSEKKPIIGAKFSVNPELIYHGLNTLTIWSTAPYEGTEFKASNTNHPLSPQEYENFIKEQTDKIPAFKEFVEDHKKFNPNKNFHVEGVWGHPNYIPLATYAPMFIGAGHLIGESYLAMKRALRNSAINLPINKPTKKALESFLTTMHTWVDTIDFTAGDSPYNLPEYSELKGWVGSTLTRKALPQIKAFNEGVATLYTSIQQSIDKEFSRDIFDTAVQNFYLAEHNKRIEEGKVQDLKNRLNDITKQYQQTTQYYKDTINAVNAEKNELSKQYNKVVESQNATQSQLRTVSKQYNDAQSQLRTVSNTNKKLNSQLRTVSEQYENATRQYESVNQQYKEATRQYNVTADMLQKMKKNIKARSTGDVEKASFNFFKDIFSGRKLWDL